MVLFTSAKHAEFPDKVGLACQTQMGCLGAFSPQSVPLSCLLPTQGALGIAGIKNTNQTRTEEEPVSNSVEQSAHGMQEGCTVG